jgi:putative redox protein
MAIQSERIEFTGAEGQRLAARLELPLGAPAGYALFAHCFTCSKDVFAASRISMALAERGIAVLRFDFTGLGGSEGDFANTNFSSNLDDLVAAADYLRAEREAPRILIGHSLGGAAVLAAAGRIPEATAVATLNAPCDPAHVQHLLSDGAETIAKEGEAEVHIGGRPFCIKKQFLDDLAGRNMPEQIGKLRKALLVMHAPQDQVVDVDNARMIYQAAKHPKSFVALDGADHLISRRGDALYAARWSPPRAKGSTPRPSRRASTPSAPTSRPRTGATIRAPTPTIC